MAGLAKVERKSSLEGLAEALAAQPPEVLELLERIDDLVFAAIAGDGGALAELEVLWPVAAEELDDELVEQSREQYLRCALSIWTECVRRRSPKIRPRDVGDRRDLRAVRDLRGRSRFPSGRKLG